MRVPVPVAPPPATHRRSLPAPSKHALTPPFVSPRQDGRCVVPWTNKTMHVIVTVYGCAVNIDNAAELD